jgi:hypothetical protein
MKIDGKFHLKIFEDGKAFFVEIHYPKNWNVQFLFPFGFQAAAGEANSRDFFYFDYLIIILLLLIRKIVLRIMWTFHNGSHLSICF